MRLLVCGGRDYRHKDVVWDSLDRLRAERELACIVHGDATGADTMAGEWARARGVPEDPVPIEPGEGGFARNQRMLDTREIDAVMHFPGGNGTTDMVTRARQAGIELIPGLGWWKWCGQGAMEL